MQESTKDLQELIEFNRTNGWPDLCPQRQLFCMRYMDSYNLQEAAKSAIVNPATASMYLREPMVLAFINDLQCHLDGRSIITKDFINLQWLKMLPKLMGEEAIPMVEKGQEVSVKKFHAAEAVNLIKELGKSIGFYDAAPSDADANAPSLNISFAVAEPLKEIKVTRGKKRES
jgi:hypothetical protein